MPVKKFNLDEIKKGVIFEIEGMNAIEIAKALTKDNFAKLYEQNILNVPRTLSSLVELNHKRNIHYKKSDMINDMKNISPLHSTQVPHIEKAFVTVDRVRRMIKSEIWIEYKKEFQKRHLQLIAEKEAERYSNEKE